MTTRSNRLERVLDALESDAALFIVVGIFSTTLLVFLGSVFATLGAQ